MKTVEAVQAAHDHALDLLRLNRSDSLGVRSMIPYLMIRLGKDQQAYDFVKWYGTIGQQDEYDWSDMDLPFLDIKTEDAFEDPKIAKWSELGHEVALTLVKLRLFFDLQFLQNCMVVGQMVPQEILDSIRENLASNAISLNSNIMQDVRDGKYLTPHKDYLKAQLDVLFADVHDSNKFFWPAVICPGADLTAMAEAHSNGSREEMQHILQYSYESWEETPKAIDWVRERLKE